MKRVLQLALLLGVLYMASAQETQRRITGVVAAATGPLKNVNVKIKNASVGVLTNGRGKYTIKAVAGDTLVFSYVGFKTEMVAIDEEKNSYGLDMYPAIQQLDEVVVKKRKKRAFTQKELLAEYPTNKSLIKTSQGILDKRRASFSLRVIDGSEILPIGPDFLSSLQAHFPNMIVQRDTVGGPFVYFQGAVSSQPAIFDVDGFINTQAPTFIIPGEVERIAVIKRNGAFARYGPAGAGGAIIVNTKEKTRVDELGVDRKYENRKLMDSLIGKVTEKKKFKPVVPDYIEKYSHVKSSDKALEIFDKQKMKYADFAPYFLDMAKYFRNKWDKKEKSQEILYDCQNKFSNDIVTLKALAYRYEELGQMEKALKIYLRVLKIESKSAQSHRDLANAYFEIGNFKKALGNYARYELAINSLDTLPFDKYGLDLLMTTEANKIILEHGKKLLPGNETFEADEKLKQNTRLLFEWNHPDADFRLRMVSPDDYYDDWSTPSVGSLQRTRGYYSKQFFLDGAFKGEWQISVNYWGNTDDIPTYLKATVFFDYGRSSQSTWSKVFKLQEKEVELKLFSIFTNKKNIAP